MYPLKRVARYATLHRSELGGKTDYAQSFGKNHIICVFERRRKKKFPPPLPLSVKISTASADFNADDYPRRGILLGLR